MRVIGMCDGADCKSSALVDKTLGRPKDWWMIRAVGTAIVGDNDHPVQQPVDEVAILCPECFSKLGVPRNVPL